VALVDEGNGSSVAVVASDVIRTPGQQPIAFSLTYATAEIDANKTYTIRAAIVDGDNAWVSATGVPVITAGAPTSGVVVPLTYRPDLLLGEVTGTLTGVDATLGDDASSVTMVVRPDTGAVLGFDARPQPGATSPIPFSVPFNVAEVDPGATYVVTSEVTDGERSWESTTSPKVITGGNPLTGVAVPLAAVATPTPSPSPTPSPTPSPAPTPSATPVPTPAPEEEGGPPWLLLLIIAAVVVGGIAAYLYTQRNDTPPPTESPAAGDVGAEPGAEAELAADAADGAEAGAAEAGADGAAGAAADGAEAGAGAAAVAASDAEATTAAADGVEAGAAGVTATADGLEAETAAESVPDAATAGPAAADAGPTDAEPATGG
jgi:uncharacterized lipoprotein YbaY